MSIIDSLLDSSHQDSDVILKNVELGDDLSLSRNVDFHFYADDEKKAENVRYFIEDNHYATIVVSKCNGKWKITAQIFMPINQNIICAISGLMTCVSHLFDVEYDGWESDLCYNKVN